MRAVILAAGIGRRLGALDAGHDTPPKILLEFDGETLLARHLAILRGCGVTQVTIVVGYAAGRIEAALAAAPADMTITTIENLDYREGSVLSLWAARDALRSGAGIILMDADVLYDRRLMERLVASPHAGALLMDRHIEAGDEPVKLCVRDGSIVDFSKRPTRAHDFHGESVGFFRLTPEIAAELADRTEVYAISAREMEYEEPIREMIMRGDDHRFGFEDVTGLPWTEIDFPDDLVKAAALLGELAK